MDLDQLHTFLEIVRLKSFSKAAETCFRTQPAISAQIRQLEQDVNTSLFDRLGTRIALTPAGRIFAGFAEQVLELRRRVRDDINELERAPRGELVIAANEATCIYVLPVVFSEFKRQFPNIQVLVDRSYGGKVVGAVLENQADFGICQLPVAEKKLQVVKIHSDEIRLIVPPGHRLAGMRAVPASELLEDALLLPKTGTTRSRLNDWLEPVDDRIRISMELDSTEMIKRFVAAGLGLGFVAASHCREEVAAGRLAAIGLAPEPMVRQLGLIYRKDKALSKAALGFIRVALSAPEAGAVMSGGTLKRSTIVISVGDDTRFYASLDEIPPDLRRRLAESTSGLDAATLLIADRGGRAELLRAMRGEPSCLVEKQPAPRRRLGWREWAGILLPGILGLGVWLVLSAR